MSTFNINSEIDKVIDKAVEQLKARIKRLIVRDEKLILKQYIASQKETTRATRGGGKVTKPKTKVAARRRAREKDYEYDSLSEGEY